MIVKDKSVLGENKSGINFDTCSQINSDENSTLQNSIATLSTRYIIIHLQI